MPGGIVGPERQYKICTWKADFNLTRIPVSKVQKEIADSPPQKDYGG